MQVHHLTIGIHVSYLYKLLVHDDLRLIRVVIRRRALSPVMLTLVLVYILLLLKFAPAGSIICHLSLQLSSQLFNPHLRRDIISADKVRDLSHLHKQLRTRVLQAVLLLNFCE